MLKKSLKTIFGYAFWTIFNAIMFIAMGHIVIEGYTTPYNFSNRNNFFVFVLGVSGSSFMLMLYQLLKSINQFIKAKLYRFLRSYYIGFKKILGSEHFIVLRPKAKPGTNQVHLDMHYHGIEEPTCIIYLKGAAQGLEANVSGNSAMEILQGGANDPDPTNN